MAHEIESNPLGIPFLNFYFFFIKTKSFGPKLTAVYEFLSKMVEHKTLGIPFINSIVKTAQRISSKVILYRNPEAL